VPKRILLVEDNDSLRYYFSDVLALAGFQVIEAADGLQALREIESNPPDLVVMDFRMPMFSVQVSQDLAANAWTRHIPVVMVTGCPQDLPPDVKVDCVLTKPVYGEQLIETVHRCLAAGAHADRPDAEGPALHTPYGPR
jgi:CheY-like chemotaxis protein